MFLCAVQDQAIRTSYVTHHVNKTSKAPCKDYVINKGESV